MIRAGTRLFLSRSVLRTLLEPSYSALLHLDAYTAGNKAFMAGMAGGCRPYDWLLSALLCCFEAVLDGNACSGPACQ